MFRGSEWTGGYNYLLNLCRVLDIYRKDVQPLVLVPRGADPQSLEPFRKISTVRIVEAPDDLFGKRLRRWFQAILFGSVPKLEDWLDHCRADIVFEAADFLGRRPRRAVLAWIPDFQHRRLPGMFRIFDRLKRELGFQAQTRSKRAIILSSAAAERDCIEFYPHSRGKTCVVHFAIPQRKAIVPDETIREKYALPAKYFYLPNQFWQHNNHIAVVNALGKLQLRIPEMVVAVSGNPNDGQGGRYFRDISELINTLGLESMFRMLGMIPYPDVNQLLRSATALVNPSLFEGWSTTVEEAKALGVPLVLSNIDVHREQAGSAAEFFDATSVRDVARSLESAWNKLSPPSGDERASMAADATDARLREFAEKFGNAMQRAIELSGK